MTCVAASGAIVDAQSATSTPWHSTQPRNGLSELDGD
eukprot:CAMPEP_0184553498 /NCGR_PEP_ID=MMETSP0199_2-20130426/32285_1 /TAXON_ID=1112570 /ORGANISM="Thraustochytrium sp., Strain LLF1b" /LENGTH=36 /DNA_ID= /DNA_START= /DNA_END= /DNA_ORIENTATION=